MKDIYSLNTLIMSELPYKLGSRMCVCVCVCVCGRFFVDTY